MGVIPEVYFNMLLAMPSQIVIYVAFTFLLDIKDKRTYWIGVIVTSAAVLALAPAKLTDFSPVIAIATTAVCLFALPMAMSKGTIHYRLFISIMVTLVLLISEIWADSLWLAISGGGSLQSLLSTDLATNVAIRVAHLTFLSILLFALYEAKSSVRAKGTSGRTILLFSSIPLSQILYLTAFLSFIGNHEITSHSVFVESSILVAVVILTDALLIRSIMKYVDAKAQAELAAQRAKEYEWYLAQCEKTVSAISSISILRHDLANQLFAIRTLSEQGEGVIAKDNLERIKKYLHNSERQSKKALEGFEDDECKDPRW